MLDDSDKVAPRLWTYSLKRELIACEEKCLDPQQFRKLSSIRNNEFRSKHLCTTLWPLPEPLSPSSSGWLRIFPEERGSTKLGDGRIRKEGLPSSHLLGIVFTKLLFSKDCFHLIPKSNRRQMMWFPWNCVSHPASHPWSYPTCCLENSEIIGSYLAI